MRTKLRLTIGILLMVSAIIGANFLIPHKPHSSFSSKKDIYIIVGILMVAFLAGFYFVYKSLSEIDKKKEMNSH
jgi:drug/metabolite transporter (DMT)-like permease